MEVLLLKKLRVLGFVPMLCMMVVIWGFSSNNGDKSSEQSLGIVGRVISAVERISGHTLDEEERLVWEERIHTPIRKLAHMTEYMIFALTVAFPFLMYRRSKRWISVFSLVYCVCYASIDELHQRFVPERSGQLKDVLIDSIGIVVGILIFRLLYGRFHSSEN